MESYLNPSNLLNLTLEIIDRLVNAYQRDLPRTVDFVDEVEHWKIRTALADDDPERLLDTLHATNRYLCPVIYRIIGILLTIPVSSPTSKKVLSSMRRMKSYLRATMGDERLSNL